MTLKDRATLFPMWADRLGGLPLRRAQLGYLLRLAALHHNNAGSLGKLSRDMGFTRTKLNEFIRRGYITAEIAARLPELAPKAHKSGVSARVLKSFVE